MPGSLGIHISEAETGEELGSERDGARRMLPLRQPYTCGDFLTNGEIFTRGRIMEKKRLGQDQSSHRVEVR
jgi:hypothetical protein